MATESSAPPRSSTRSLRPLPLGEILLCLLILVGAWFLLVGRLAWLPAWLYLGPIEFDSVSLIQGVFAAVIVVSLGVRRQRQNRLRPGELVIAGLAGVTVLAAVYATITLNTAPGGVFWASFLPLGAGVLLALVDLVYRSALVLESAGTVM